MVATHTVFVGDKSLPGFLTVPEKPKGLIIFAHGSGSSRNSPRNAAAARGFEQLGFATLLFDLLSEPEAKDRRNVFDIPLLASRINEAIAWARSQPRLEQLPIGLFGASTGGGAALLAAASSADVRAVVSRGGRPDLAGEALRNVNAPTLLIVGSEDRDVLALNDAAAEEMRCPKRLSVVPGAGHLFEEPGTMDHMLAIAGAWFLKHLAASQQASLPFANREHAGKLLGRVLADRRFHAPVVYALPRGGVPVALPIARALNAPVDVLMVRKIGVPWQPEVAAASVIDGEQADIVLIEQVLRSTGLDESQIHRLAKSELAEIERRRRIYLPGRKPVPARGRTAILVDDGIATGTSMRAAILAVRKRHPSAIVLAVPVAARESLRMLGPLVDDAVAIAVPQRFHSVGEYFLDFHQLSDQEVIDLLKTPAKDATQ